MASHVGERPSAAAGLMYGIGLGGFVDGIVLHQLLQWHWRLHLGGVLAGWGGFNLVGGIVDHQLLRIHHVRDDLGGPLAWDVGFLAVGTGLVLAGWLLARTGSRALDARGWTPTPDVAAGAA